MRTMHDLLINNFFCQEKFAKFAQKFTIMSIKNLFILLKKKTYKQAKKV